MNNMRDSDDEATTFVSAQPGAPLPGGVSEDTVIGASIPGFTADPSPARGEVGQDAEMFGLEPALDTAGETEFAERESVATVDGELGALELVVELDDTYIPLANDPRSVAFEENTVSGPIASEDHTASNPASTAPVASHGSSGDIGVVTSEDENDLDIGRETVAAFNPLTDNEAVRIQGIREVKTVVDPSTIATPSRPEGVRTKAPQTAQQVWKKNQARRKQKRIVLVAFLVVMAAVGGLVAVVVSTFVR